MRTIDSMGEKKHSKFRTINSWIGKKNMEKFTGTNSDGESIWSFWIICVYAWMSVCIGLMKHWILCTKSGKSFSQNLGSEYYMVVWAINHHTFIIQIVFTNNFTLFPFDYIQLVVQPCNIFDIRIKFSRPKWNESQFYS